MSGKNDTVVDYDNLGAALSDEAENGPSSDTGNDSAAAARLAEKDAMIGRQSNEIGELRGMINQLSQQVSAVQSQPSHPAPTQDEPLNVSPEDLVENPARVIESVLSRYEKKRQAEENDRLSNIEAALTSVSLTARHPDYVQVSNSPEFTSWAQGDPLRVSAFQRARAGDTDAAVSLLDSFKSARAASPNLADATANAHADARESQTVTQGETAKPTGKIFKRSAIMKLRVENPEEYTRLNPVILQAYAEGRVVD